MRTLRLSSLLLILACRAHTATPPPAAPAPTFPAGWDMDWWREARFGMFIHWGVYSQLAGVWEGEPVKGYAEHIQRIRKITMADYRAKAVEQFNPVGFDADTWVRTLKDAGMGYLIITAKHHDGFAMYDSAVNDYNVVKATPWKRDPMRALKDACDRQGVKFGFYYSHAFDWGDPNGAGNDWEWDNPGGDRHLHGGDRWWEKEPDRLLRARRYVDGKAIPQVRELIRKYDPAIIWFDTPSKLPPEETLRVLRAAREAKPTLVVNSRVVGGGSGVPSLPTGFGDYRSTTDKPAEFPPQPGDWEAIPTTNESYGYHRMDDSHKPPAHFIRLLAKAAARGGNVLLNIGPRGDGTMDPKDVEILRTVGAWMKINGGAIRGTTRTPLPVQAWGESTRKGNTLYLHVFDWPADGKLVVGGLRADVARAYALDDPGRALPVERAGEDLVVRVPPRAGDAVDTVIALEARGEIATDGRRLLSPTVPVDTLRAFDGELQGHHLGFGAGKSRDAWVHGWSDLHARVRWPVRLTAPATYDVFVSYDADEASAGGAYAVTLGSQTLAGTVEKTPAEPVRLGRVALAPGSFDIAVAATKIAGGELMRLRAVELQPVPQ